MEHVLSKTILITKVIELIADHYKITLEEARNRFYKTNIINLIDDDTTGLYGESPLYVFSLYERSERVDSTVRQLMEDLNRNKDQ